MCFGGFDASEYKEQKLLVHGALRCIQTMSQFQSASVPQPFTSKDQNKEREGGTVTSHSADSSDGCSDSTARDEPVPRTCATCLEGHSV